MTNLLDKLDAAEAKLQKQINRHGPGTKQARKALARVTKLQAKLDRKYDPVEDEFRQLDDDTALLPFSAMTPLSTLEALFYSNVPRHIRPIRRYFEPLDMKGVWKRLAKEARGDGHVWDVVTG